MTPTTATQTRRNFLEHAATGWTLFTLASVAGILATVRFFFPNDLFEPPTKFTIGSPEDYSDGVDAKWKAKYQIWVVREMGRIIVLSTVCTHLGCTPNWLSTEIKFKCPCHGSGFYGPGSGSDPGVNFEGPAPRPLERFKIGLAPDGQITVDKGKKYQQELGQWKDPDSFLVV